MDDFRSASRPPSDEQLVALLRQGDHSAFNALATRYHTRLLRFCWQILRSKEDAEDALQDVFAAAFRAMLADQREIQVRPWLYRIAKNRCLSKLRSRPAVRVDSLEDDHADRACTPADTLVGREIFREFVTDVQALPDTQRTALLLREIDGFGYQQIATALGTTVPSVKSLLVRARAGLRDLATARNAGLTAQGRPPAPCTPIGHARHSSHAINYQSARAAAALAA